jgi:hypothetical protein
MNKSNQNSQKGSSGILVVFLVLVLIALTGVTVYFWQNYEKEKALNALRMSTSNESGKANITPPVDTNVTIVTAPATQEKTPVVVYSPNGLFNQAETAEIKKKLIDPFTDWNIDNKITVVSIMIEKPTPAIAGYKYKVTYIAEGGVSGGFLFGTSTPLEWWLPECLGGCSFSADFKAKYPEIVAKMSQ